MPTEWRGTRLASVSDFPLLVKFIFPTDKLSIQVHPDDAYASVHEIAAGGRGKTEMWHVVSAKPGAHLLLGMKPGASKETFRESMRTNSLEDLFVEHPVHAGETFFVPARTAHTIGSDMVICEVQEYSDLTYRVYDYGRVDANGQPRELHVEKALEVLNFGPTDGGVTSPLRLESSGANRSLLAACSYFAAERWELDIHWETQTDPSHFELLTVLEGSGVIEAPGFSAKFRQAQCWFLPANLHSYELVGSEPSTLLRAYVPNLDSLRQEAKNSGHVGASCAHTIFG